MKLFRLCADSGWGLSSVGRAPQCIVGVKSSSLLGSTILDSPQMLIKFNVCGLILFAGNAPPSAENF